jgi:hypothetical protein
LKMANVKDKVFIIGINKIVITMEVGTMIKWMEKRSIRII